MSDRRCWVVYFSDYTHNHIHYIFFINFVAEKAKPKIVIWKWVAAWQNQQNDLYAQRILRSAWADAHPSLRWAHIILLVLSCSASNVWDDQQTHWFSKTVYLLTLIHHWKLMTWWSVGPMIMCRMVQSARNWNPFLMWNSPTLSALCLSLPEKKLPLQLGQSTAIPTKYAFSEDSNQPAHMQSVFRSSGVPSKKVWVLSFQKRCRRRQIRTHGCAGWPVFPRCRTSVGYTLDVQADPESSLGAGLL